MIHSYTFKKEERLCSRKEISSLFEDGHTFSLFPFRIFWNYTISELQYPAQVAVSVSKKIFKRAVDRNRIKRLTREAWRHNKHTLYSYLEQSNQRIVLMLVYTSGELPTQAYISKKTEEAVLKLLLILQKKDRPTG